MRDRVRVCLGAVLFEVALGGIGILLGWLFGVPATQTLHNDWLSIPLGILATLPLWAFFLVLVRSHWEPLDKIRRYVDAFVKEYLAPCGRLEYLFIAVAAGLGEELLFRGCIQGILSSWTGPWIGLVLASIAFGFAHAVTATYVVLAGGIGFYLGAVWILTDNLWVPVIAHALYDFLALSYLNASRLAHQHNAKHCRPTPSQQTPLETADEDLT